MKDIRKLLEPHSRTLIALMSRSLPDDTTKDQLEALLDQEIFNFTYRFDLDPDLNECMDASIENAFRKTIMQGLSFDADFGLIYLMGRNSKVAGREVKLLECNKTVNGWISLYKMAGSLEDIGTPITEFDPTTGLVKKLTVTLICPQYATTGEVENRIEKPFEFKEEDFVLWQKKSHEIKISQRTPGNAKTLNLSGPNYWNYKSKLKSADFIPTADNHEGCGINPSFAITKCTRHALKRANLSLNPYGKKFVKFSGHKKYVEEDVEVVLEELLEKSKWEDDRNSPPHFAEDATPPVVQAPVMQASVVVQAPPIKVENPWNEKIENVVDNLLAASILKEFEDCNTADECRVMWNKYKEIIVKDDNLKSKVSKIGIDRGKNPRNVSSQAEQQAPKQEEQKSTQSEEIDASNI